MYPPDGSIWYCRATPCRALCCPCRREREQPWVTSAALHREEALVAAIALTELPTAIHEMARRLVRDFDPDLIILFGSYARGTAGPNSDADLLGVMPVR